jgi:hypothetical protein
VPIDHKCHSKKSATRADKSASDVRNHVAHILANADLLDAFGYSLFRQQM